VPISARRPAPFAAAPAPPAENRARGCPLALEQQVLHLVAMADSIGYVLARPGLLIGVLTEFLLAATILQLGIRLTVTSQGRHRNTTASSALPRAAAHRSPGRHERPPLPHGDDLETRHATRHPTLMLGPWYRREPVLLGVTLTSAARLAGLRPGRQATRRTISDNHPNQVAPNAAPEQRAPRGAGSGKDAGATSAGRTARREYSRGGCRIAPPLRTA
jgi:hypothetical protein